MMIFEKLIYYFFEYLPTNKKLGVAEFLSGFIPILFVLFFLKSFGKKYRILLFYGVVIFLFEIINNIYSAFSINNHDVYLIFYIIESGILLFYFKNIINEKLYTSISYIIFIFISILFLLNVFSEIDLMNNVSSSMQSLFFIFISIVNYYFILSKLNISNLTNSTFFWINTATFLYFTGKYFVSLYLLEINGDTSNDDLVVYWEIVSVLLVIQRILISIGISKLKYEKPFPKLNGA